MPTLDWIGKKAVVNHHQEVPYHLLRDVPELGCGPTDSGNLIVEGDNLTTLKALLPYYAGQVKCIYIDPPYNTGNEGWVYNDNVNSPEIKAWLGKVVGKEAEDLSRHDKWLCMMYPRLRLLREFLREDGAIFINIDDAEYENLRLMSGEIFGDTNHVGTVIWQHSVQPKGYLGKLSVHHNYLLIFARSPAFSLGDVPRRDEHNVNYSNPDADPKGAWRAGDVRNALYRPNLIYDLKTPSGKTIKPPPKGWRWSKETMAAKIESGEIIFRADETKILRKIYLENQEGRAPESIWFGEDVGTTREANQELKEIFGGHSPFDTPKPVRLLERIIQISIKPGDIVLDSFAGSGTTAHAVMRANRESTTGERRFVLVEIDSNIAKSATAKRVGLVSGGYTNAKGEKVTGLGGGFRYVQLGEPLFDAAGKIRSTVRFRALARHVFFTETGAPLPHDAPCDKPLLGVAHGTGVYLLYNGILKDKSVDGGNVLTQPILDSLPEHDGPKVIYAASNRVSPSRLKARGITFKQTPYAIKVR